MVGFKPPRNTRVSRLENIVFCGSHSLPPEIDLVELFWLKCAFRPFLTILLTDSAKLHPDCSWISSISRIVFASSLTLTWSFWPVSTPVKSVELNVSLANSLLDRRETVISSLFIYSKFTLLAHGMLVLLPRGIFLVVLPGFEVLLFASVSS